MKHCHVVIHSSDTNSGRNIAIKNNVSALKKLSNLTHKERKFHLNNWGVDAFKDIKKISQAICKCKKIPRKKLILLKPHKKSIRKIASSSDPEEVKKVLVNQKGGFLFSALGSIIPALIGTVIQAFSPRRK